MQYYSIEQKHNTPAMDKDWIDTQVPEFDQKVFKLDESNQAAFLEYVRSTTFLFEVKSGEEEPEISPDLSGALADTILDNLQKCQAKIWSLPDTRIHSQHIVLYKRPAIAEYRFDYQGGTYRSWINAANGQVRELDDGVIAHHSAMLQADALAFKKKGNWQRALYLSSKGMAARNSKELKGLRDELYGLVKTIVTFPALMVVIGLVCLQLDYLRTTEGQLSCLMSFMLLGLFHQSFSQDLAIKTRFGLGSLLALGLVLGLAAAPLNLGENSLSPGWLLIQCIFTLLIVLGRTGRRRPIVKWDKFLDAKPDSAKVIKAVENLRPSIACSLLCSLWILIIGTISIAMLFQSGIPQQHLIMLGVPAILWVCLSACMGWTALRTNSSLKAPEVPRVTRTECPSLPHLLTDGSSPSVAKVVADTLPIPPVVATSADRPSAPRQVATVEPAPVVPAQLPMPTPLPVVTAMLPIEPARTSGLAITSLVLGILGLFCPVFILSIPAVVFAIIGLRQTRNPRVTGKGMAIAGLTLGGVGICLSIVVVVAMVLAPPTK